MPIDANGQYYYEPFGTSNPALQNQPSIYNYGSTGVPENIAAPPPGTPGVDSGVKGGGPTGFNPYIQGIQAISGLANVALGFKGLDLSNKQFRFAKDSFNTNLANQAQLTNTQLEGSKRARLSASGVYDRNTQTGRDALEANLQSYVADNRVSGAPV